MRLLAVGTAGSKASLEKVTAQGRADFFIGCAGNISSYCNGSAKSASTGSAVAGSATGGKAVDRIVGPEREGERLGQNAAESADGWGGVVRRRGWGDASGGIGR